MLIFSILFHLVLCRHGRRDLPVRHLPPVGLPRGDGPQQSSQLPDVPAPKRNGRTGARGHLRPQRTHAPSHALSLRLPVHGQCFLFPAAAVVAIAVVVLASLLNTYRLCSTSFVLSFIFDVKLEHLHHHHHAHVHHLKRHTYTHDTRTFLHCCRGCCC